MPGRFVLVGKDDWPLFRGDKNRTVDDFRAALAVLVGHWERLGRRTDLALLLLEPELLATNPASPEFDSAAGAVLEDFLALGESG